MTDFACVYQLTHRTAVHASCHFRKFGKHVGAPAARGGTPGLCDRIVPTASQECEGTLPCPPCDMPGPGEVMHITFLDTC